MFTDNEDIFDHCEDEDEIIETDHEDNNVKIFLGYQKDITVKKMMI